MRTKPWLIVASLCCLAISAQDSFGDEASHRKAAEELLVEMGVDKQMQMAIDQMLDIQIKSNPQIARFRAPMKKFFAKHMSWESLKDEFITIYVDAFDEGELNEIKAFYLTPAGKKLVKKSPELMTKGMQLGAGRVQKNQAELERMLREEVKKPEGEPEAS